MVRDLAWRLRTKAGPLLVWAGTVAGAITLGTGTETELTGFVHTVSHTVSPTRTAQVAVVAVQLGQAVEAGHVVATLETGTIDGQIRLAEAERRRLEAAVAAGRAVAGRELARLDRRFGADRDDLERKAAAAASDLGTRRAERRAVRHELATLGALVREGMADRANMASLRVRAATLGREVAGAERRLEVIESQLQAARPGQPDLPPEETDQRGDTDPRALAVAPLERERDAADELLRELRRQRATRVLRTPLSGYVAAVHKRPGEVARAGEPVVTIVASDPERVIACLSEDTARDLPVGTRAGLRPRGASGERLGGVVASVGPVEELPVRCRARAREPMWGRTMVLRLDVPQPLIAGQAFDVRIEPRGTDGVAHAAPRSAPQAAPALEGGPSVLDVPPDLRRLSRLEPSGLVWMPAWQRYLVVSDDTGHRGAGSNHAPWLFTMDRVGRFDAAPRVISGLDAVDDLEAIARAADGSIYVLASQSVSKKGRRPPARALLARLVSAGPDLALAGHFGLVERLQEAPVEYRAELGVGSLDALDIEGMTAEGGDLFLGLKAPLAPRDRAIVWRLSDPERLLAGALPGPENLTRWGSVALQVTADGRRVPGGIADLLWMPDGSLLVAATASGGDPDAQSGALWRVADPSGGDMLGSEVRTFEGLKPEGLALSAIPGKVAVVFDLGAALPRWSELEWPR